MAAGFLAGLLPMTINRRLQSPKHVAPKRISPPTTVLVSAPRPIAVSQNRDGFVMVVHQQVPPNSANMTNTGTMYQQSHVITRNAGEAQLPKFATSKTAGTGQSLKEHRTSYSPAKQVNYVTSASSRSAFTQQTGRHAGK